MSDERVWTNSTAVRHSRTAAAWGPDSAPRQDCGQCGRTVRVYPDGVEHHDTPPDERGRTARCRPTP